MLTLFGVSIALYYFTCLFLNCNYQELAILGFEVKLKCLVVPVLHEKK